MRAKVPSLLLALLAAVPAAKADTLTEKRVAKELSADSALPLRQNVATMWADNLLTAQLPGNCSY